MRKKGMALACVLAVAILFTTGCGNQVKTLLCNQTTNGVDVQFNVGFKGNRITTMDFSYDMDLSKYTDTQISAIEKQDFCSIVKSSLNDYKDAFTNCQQKIVEKHLKVDSGLDINKITKNLLQKISTPEAAKKEIEGQGYTCTIK